MTETMLVGDWKVTAFLNEDESLTLNVEKNEGDHIFISDDLSETPDMWQETFFVIADGEETPLQKKIREKFQKNDLPFQNPD